jgi:DNA-binding MarR family transcriptional regulator
MRALIFETQPNPEIDALPMAQLRLLWSVHFASNSTMKELSERLMVSQSTVTQLADRLVNRGLIERHADATDRRVVRLQMSLQGRQLMDEADTPRRQIMQAVWDRFSLEERERVLEVLDIVAKTAERARAEIGIPLPPMPEESCLEGNVTMGEQPASQSVVDIMSRPVRGKTPVL